MKIKTSLKSIFDQQLKVTVEKEYDSGLSISEIKEERTALDTDVSSSENVEILLDGVILNIRYDQIQEPVELSIDNDFPCIRVDFEVEGHSQYFSGNPKSIDVEIEKNHFNFFYFPEVKGKVCYDTKTRKSMSIMVTREYLDSAFNNNIDHIASDLAAAMRTEVPYKMFAISKPISSDLLLIINDIISCSYQKEIKQVYLESKIKEVFSYLFSEMNKDNTEDGVHQLKRVEYENIKKVEGILRQKLDKSITIRELSELTGMNQNKLKRNFKLAYQEPIVSYLTTMRMEKAKQLLLNNEVSISEVASAVGYKNHQHFTAAFKRRFNYLPKELRKKAE